MIRVEIKTDAMMKALGDYARDLEQAASQSMRLGLDVAKKFAVLRTSQLTKKSDRQGDHLVDSFIPVQISATRGKLFNISPHAIFMRDGTRAHFISAVHAKYLHFTGSGGESVFRKTVHHPGTEARDFMTPALLAGEVAIRGSLQHKADDLARAFGR